MKCKKCGFPCAKHVVSRRELWKGRSGARQGRLEPRTDFRVKCSKCGAEYEDKQKEVQKLEI